MTCAHAERPVFLAAVATTNLQLQTHIDIRTCILTSTHITFVPQSGKARTQPLLVHAAACVQQQTQDSSLLCACWSRDQGVSAFPVQCCAALPNEKTYLCNDWYCVGLTLQAVLRQVHHDSPGVAAGKINVQRLNCMAPLQACLLRNSRHTLRR